MFPWWLDPSTFCYPNTVIGPISAVHHGISACLLVPLVGGLEMFGTYIGNFIIPTDELICFRGGLNHQPDHVYSTLTCLLLKFLFLRFISDFCGLIPMVASGRVLSDLDPQNHPVIPWLIIMLPIVSFWVFHGIPYLEKVTFSGDILTFIGEFLVGPYFVLDPQWMGEGGLKKEQVARSNFVGFCFESPSFFKGRIRWTVAIFLAK